MSHSQRLLSQALRAAATAATATAPPPAASSWLRGNGIVGIRRETKNRWERRAPLTPAHVRKLRRKGIRVLVQPSNMRFFSEDQYVAAGAEIVEDLTPASVILGVKEVPIDLILPNKTYMCFSHTIKAQPGNMKMLDAFLERRVRLIDYECMVDARGKRLVGFGMFAGTAGMIDALRGLGDRLLGLGYTNPFLGLGYAGGGGRGEAGRAEASTFSSNAQDYYHSVSAAKSALQLVGNNILLNGVPKDIAPIIFGFTGAGNVARGVFDILNHIPIEMVEMEDLPKIIASKERKMLFGVKIERQHMVERIGARSSQPFDVEHYTKNPHEYQPRFHRDYAPLLTVLVNCMYWDARFPRLITDEQMKQMYLSGTSRLLQIADISADPYGSIQFTRKCTTIDRPFLVHNPVTGEQIHNWEAEGVLIGSVDNLPAELPFEASQHFGDNLLPFVFPLAWSNGELPFAEQANDLGSALHNAVITNQGQLTPRFSYIAKLRADREAEEKKQAGGATTSSSSSSSTTTPRSPGKTRVLLLGSGMVAGSFVHQLAQLCGDKVSLTIGGIDAAAGERLAARFPGAKATAVSVAENATGSSDLKSLVQDHDVVVSLLPAFLHPTVAQLCVELKKHMVTTSYTSDALAALHNEAKAAGITMLHECGLDPGIDHFKAVDMLARVREQGGTVTGFESWCGGLPAPHCAGPDPLRYRFSWSPRGVLVASTQGARFREEGRVVEVKPGALPSAARPVVIGSLALVGTPNRDSIMYEEVYGLQGGASNAGGSASSGLQTMLRGTLRYAGFWPAMTCLQDAGLLRLEPWKLKRGQKLAVGKWASLGGADTAEQRAAVEVLRGCGVAEDVVCEATSLDTLASALGQALAYRDGEVDMVVLTHKVDFVANGRQQSKRAELVCFGSTSTSAMAHTVGSPAALAAQYVVEQGGTPSLGVGVVKPTEPALSRRFLQDLHSKMGIVFKES